MRTSPNGWLRLSMLSCLRRGLLLGYTNEVKACAPHSFPRRSLAGVTFLETWAALALDRSSRNRIINRTTSDNRVSSGAKHWEERPILDLIRCTQDVSIC